MERIKALADKIDSLSIRERGVILAGVIFVMYALWDSFLIQPQLVEERKLLADLQIKRAEQSAFNIRLQGMLNEGAGDPDAANRRRLAELKAQLEQIEGEVRASAGHLVTPAAMARILRTILDRSGGLILTEIKGLGARPLLSGAAVNTPAAGAADKPVNGGGGIESAYKHGLIIRFEGDYFSTLDYIRELESLEWDFFWDSMEYEVVEYPRGRVMLTLYTLSLEKDWIGV